MEKKSKEREIFADILRTIAIIFVLIIHTTCNYLSSTYGDSVFKYALAIDTIVCIAVPLFFMLSGCFLINEKTEFNSKHWKRILKRVVQLLFWTIVYLLVEKYYLKWDITI